jgi:putative heme-binding domain-containing protein
MKIMIVINLIGVLSMVAALAASDPLKILIVTGGHPFEEKAFFDMFRAIPNVSYTHAVLGGEAERLMKPEEAKNYDALVFYDMNQKCDGYLDDLFALMERGKGAVFLHHALGSCSESLEYGYMLGGRARFGKPPGSTIDTTRFAGNTSYRAHIEDQNHPITGGMSDFDVTDEVYSKYFVNTHAHILLTTNHPSSGKPIAWSWKYRQSPVVYIQLGHDHVTYENPNYRKLVERSLRWVAGKTPTNAGASGERLYFSLGCPACHGNDARGSRGPNLRGSVLWSRSDAQQHAFDVIKHGVKGTEMPAYPGTSDNEIIELVAYLGRVPSDGKRASSGDARRGSKLFRLLECARCHGPEGRGDLLGPELASVLRAKGPDHLRNAVRQPTKELPFNHTPIAVVAKDGRRFTGIRRNEDSFSLQMVDGLGDIHLFLKEELRTITHERKSLMPQYDESQLPSNALADLFAYLQTVK